MKQLSALIIVGMMCLTLTGCDACKDNVFTSLKDTIATIGKQGVDKDAILAKRKAFRAAKCAEQQASAMKKKMGF